MAREHAGALKVRLKAPAPEDRANESLRRILAARLKVPIAAVRIVARGKNRFRRVAIAGAALKQFVALADRAAR